MAGVILAVALAAAAGGALWVKRGAAPVAKEPTTAEPPPAPLTVSAAPVPPPVVVHDTPPPAPSVSPAAAIRVSVVTEPAGATLSKDGFQVCDQTPCEVTAAPNETFELTAVKGALRGVAKVLAQRDQRVSIRLTGSAPRASSAAPPPLSSGKPQCEVMVGDLKILRDCP
jgi:hypothetical protein